MAAERAEGSCGPAACRSRKGRGLISSGGSLAVTGSFRGLLEVPRMRRSLRCRRTLPEATGSVSAGDAEADGGPGAAGSKRVRVAA